MNRYGITQKDVATAAGVSKFMVSHVLAGRAKSARVVAIVRQMIADAKAVREKQAERGRVYYGATTGFLYDSGSLATGWVLR